MPQAQAAQAAQAMRKEKKTVETAGPSGVGSVVAGSNSKFSSDQRQLVAAHHQSQGQGV